MIFQDELKQIGFVIERGAISTSVINPVMRLLYKDVWESGLSPQKMRYWNENQSWFPHLRKHDEIEKLLNVLPEWCRPPAPCEAQIIVTMPSDDHQALPNTDENTPYSSIVGIPLTGFNHFNGGICIWPFDNRSPFCPALSVGDIIILHPKLRYIQGPNLNGGPRHAVYFKFLEEKT